MSFHRQLLTRNQTRNKNKINLPNPAIEAISHCQVLENHHRRPNLQRKMQGTSSKLLRLAIENQPSLPLKIGTLTRVTWCLAPCNLPLMREILLTTALWHLDQIANWLVSTRLSSLSRQVILSTIETVQLSSYKIGPSIRGKAMLSGGYPLLRPIRPVNSKMTCKLPQIHLSQTREAIWLRHRRWNLLVSIGRSNRWRQKTR